MTRQWSFTLPHTKPPKGLSANDRVHYMVKAKATEAIRNWTSLVVVGHVPAMLRCRVDVVWVVKDRRRRTRIHGEARRDNPLREGRRPTLRDHHHGAERMIQSKVRRIFEDRGFLVLSDPDHARGFSVRRSTPGVRAIGRYEVDITNHFVWGWTETFTGRQDHLSFMEFDLALQELGVEARA